MVGNVIGWSFYLVNKDSYELDSFNLDTINTLLVHLWFASFPSLLVSIVSLRRIWKAWLTLWFWRPVLVRHRITVRPVQRLVLSLQRQSSVTSFGHVFSLEDKHVFQFVIHTLLVLPLLSSDECLDSRGNESQMNSKSIAKNDSHKRVAEFTVRLRSVRSVLWVMSSNKER